VRHDPVTFTFDHDAQGWTGVDKVATHAGHLTVTRAKNLRPIAHVTPLSGDWPILFGGETMTISAKVRAPKPGGAVRVEIFASDVAGWSFEKLPPFTTEWQTVSTTLRYDWTDAQAETAGWHRPTQGFSWRETIRKAGRIVIMVGQTGTQESFDLDDVRLEAK
jgi:hypothetical protein